MGNSTSPALPIGARVGNYQIVEVLGEGGSSVVYRAIHAHVRREVALKVLGPEFPRSRFLAEARAIGSISTHPNIVEVFDCGTTDDGRPYYVMELLQGRDLSQVLAGRTLTPAEVLPYLEQVCAGLEAAHRAGVIHRDVKQANVFVLAGAALRLKLFDFGVARLPELLTGDMAATGRGMVIGTPAVMAPEQAAGEPDRIGPQTDIYSLGVMLYQMLAGRPPFEDDDVVRVLQRHIREEPPALAAVAPDVPLPVCEVVHRCLQKDPQRRYASARQLYEALSAAVSAGPDQPDEGCASQRVGDDGLAQSPGRSSAASGPVDADPLLLGLSPEFGAGRSQQFELEGVRLPTSELQRVPRPGSRERGGGHGLAWAGGAAVVLLALAWIVLRGGDSSETSQAPPPGGSVTSVRDSRPIPVQEPDAAGAAAVVADDAAVSGSGKDAASAVPGAALAGQGEELGSRRVRTMARRPRRLRAPVHVVVPPATVDDGDDDGPASTSVPPVGEVLEVHPAPKP